MNVCLLGRGLLNVIYKIVTAFLFVFPLCVVLENSFFFFVAANGETRTMYAGPAESIDLKKSWPYDGEQGKQEAQQ